MSIRDQAGVLLLALVVRILHLIFLEDSPYFDHPIIDAQTYDEAARAIAAGAGHPDAAFWQPPGYPYFLGLVYASFGSGYLAPRLLQILLGAGSSVLAARIGATLFGRRAGLGAGIGAALYGTLIYFDLELLPSTLGIFLQLVSIEFATRAERKGEARWWILSGVTMGLASVVLAPSLILLAVLAFFARRRAPVLLLSAALLIAPVTWRNISRGGEFVLISFNGGINLYIGNNPDYEGTVGIRPDREWKRLSSEPYRNGARGYRGHSAYFVGKVRNFITSDPGGFVRLQLHKLRLFAGGDEIYRNQAIYPVRQESPALSLLLFKFPGLALPWGLVFPLAMIGLVTCGKRARMLAACAVSYAACVVAFFVTARYRAPLIPWLLIFAAAGVRWWMVDAGPRARGYAGATFALVFLIANTGQGAMEERMNADAEYSLAVHLADEGAEGRAIDLYRRVLEEKPDYAEAWVNLGSLELARGGITAAESCFSAAAGIDSLDPDAPMNLGNLKADRGEIGDALDFYRRALELRPGHAMTLENLRMVAARLEADLAARSGGDNARATASEELVAAYRLLIDAGSPEPALLSKLLLALESRGEFQEAIRLLEAALARSPGDPSLLFTMGRLQVLAGQEIEGVATLRRALATGNPRVEGWIANNPALRAVAGDLLGGETP